MIGQDWNGVLQGSEQLDATAPGGPGRYYVAKDWTDPLGTRWAVCYNAKGARTLYAATPFQSHAQRIAHLLNLEEAGIAPNAELYLALVEAARTLRQTMPKGEGLISIPPQWEEMLELLRALEELNPKEVNHIRTRQDVVDILANWLVEGAGRDLARRVSMAADLALEYGEHYSAEARTLVAKLREALARQLADSEPRP